MSRKKFASAPFNRQGLKKPKSETQIVWDTKVGEAYEGSPLWSLDGKLSGKKIASTPFARLGLKKPESCMRRNWVKLMKAAHSEIWTEKCLEKKFASTPFARLGFKKPKEK